MAKPLDARLNNPLNIENGGPYEGEADPPAINGKRNFISPPWGFRAAFRNYITKYDRGVTTIRQLITQWSPATGEGNSQESTDAYIESVSRKSGFGPDDVVALKTWDVASKICYAQTEFESGQPFGTLWKVADMAEGALRAGIVDAPTPITRRIVQKVAGSGAAISSGAAAAEPIVSGWAGVTHSPSLQTIFLVLAGILALIAALVKK